MCELEDFVGYTIKRDLTKITLNIYQPHIITKITQGFKENMKSLMTFNIPDTPHKGIVNNQEKYTKISHNLKKRYSSGVGSLLHLLNHSRPELSNTVRELSQFMDKANMSHCLSHIRAIKYIIDTKDYCYQIKPEGNLNGTW